MTCPNCNKSLPDGLSFCTNCGSRISQQSSQYQQPIQYQSQQSTQYQSQIPIEPISFHGSQYPSAEPQPPEDVPVKKKKSKVLVITAIVTAIALVLSCGAGWWFLWGPGAKVTVYAPASVDEYDENGIHYRHTEYTFDDQGRILSVEIDIGEYIENWNEEKEYYEYTYGPIDGKLDMAISIEYDDDGYLARIEYGYSDEDIDITRLDWELDDDGYPDTVTIRSDDDSTEQYFKHEDGRITAVYTIDDDGERDYELKVEYDEDGRITEKIYSSYYVTRYEYKYDDDGRLTQEKVSERDNDEDAPWENQETTKYTYDNKGRLSKVVETDENGEETYRAKYGYDNKGNLISVTKEYEYGSEYSCEYTYDGKTRKSSETTRIDSDGDRSTTETEYDKDGNPSRASSDDGSYTTYSFEKLRLSKEDAAIYYRQLHGSMFDSAYSMLIPTPIDPETEADLWSLSF